MRLLKITAIAHPIQGLIKYHGLKDPVKRIPFHDSISVCEKGLTSTTTVEVKPSHASDRYLINGAPPSPKEAKRLQLVLGAIRRKSRTKLHARIESKNTLTKAKGIGFSASGMAALGFAANKALEADLSDRELSEIVRLGAGSATRSLAGGFAVWYANRDGASFAERLKCPKESCFRMLIAPLHSEVTTDEAHREVLSSPFFRKRVSSAQQRIGEMTGAIERGDLAKIGELAENDTLNLAAVTMTGKTGLVLWEPKTLEIIKCVRSMREQNGLLCWFSIDTGPSVFINTNSKNIEAVKATLSRVFPNLLESVVGGRPKLIDEHIF